jgi:ACS family sodium-dependent inorganic phosphate cotransporter
VLGGYLADRFGGSLVLQAGMVLWSLLTVLTPMAASHGVWTAVAARVGLGLGEGAWHVASHALH